MAKKRGDGDQQEPTLELPSLFGRGRKRRREPEAEPAAVREAESEAVPEAESGLGGPAETEPEPAVAAEPVPEPRRKSAKPPRARKPAQRVAVADAAPPRRAARTPRTVPVLPAAVAAAVTGLVIGLAGTALTYVSLRGCEMLQGTESCGAPGLGLLVVIIVLMMLGGAVMLRLLGVAEPRGSSFLGIGLMCVIVLVTLMEDLFSGWMFVAVPLICAVTYALAQWVTTQFVETADDRPHVDVR